MSTSDDLGTWAKWTQALKDIPLWVLLAFTGASLAVVFLPNLIGPFSSEYQPWFRVAAILFTALTTFKILAATTTSLYTLYRSSRPKKVFHLSPDTTNCNWSVSKQPDNSFVTQIIIDALVKNQTSTSIGLVAVHLLKPRMSGEVVHSDVIVRHAEGTVYGTAMHSGHRIPGGAALPARLSLMIRGTPRENQSKPLAVTVRVVDDEDNSQRLSVTCRSLTITHKPTPEVPSEPLYAMENPIEKEVAAVLKAEVSRYSKRGRTVGGFGSIEVRYRGVTRNGFGTDSWSPGSAANQEVALDPENAELISDNLSALTHYYGRLDSDEAREQFVEALVDRLHPDRGYLNVSYFIVAALMQVGKLSTALDIAKMLPRDDRKEHGLSNVLLMLNGLLRYRHTDFSDAMLDEIERFLHGLDEHQFHIPQKLAAVRALRLATR